MKSKLRTHTNIKRGGLVACALIGLLLSGFSGTVEAATYYLDAVNGDDGNPGTSELPWKTIDRAKADSAESPKVGLGDIVYLRSGNYGDVTFEYSNPAPSSWDEKITYKAETGHSPVITDMDILNNDMYLEFNGITFEPAAATAGIYIYNSGHLRFINCTLTGTWNTNYEDSETGYDQLSGGFYISGGTAEAPMSDITISGCAISQVIRGISISCYMSDTGGRWLITNNEVHTTSNSQIKVQSLNTGLEGSSADSIVVSDNHLHDYYPFHTGIDYSHASGIAVKACHITIERNTIHATGSTAGIGLYSNGGEDGVGYHKLVIQNNLIYDNQQQYAVRLWDVSESGSIIFRNNTIIGYHGSGSDTYYYGVVVHVRAFGWYNDDGIDSAAGSGLEFCNNVILGKVSFDGSEDNNAGLESMQENYNYMYSAYNDSGIIGSHDNTTIVTTDDYDDSMESGFFAGTINLSNLHRQNLNTSYKLTEDSPAIGHADPANAPSTDILGYQRDNDPDAGCYEYGATPSIKYLFGVVSP